MAGEPGWLLACRRSWNQVHRPMVNRARDRPMATTSASQASRSPNPAAVAVDEAMLATTTTSRTGWRRSVTARHWAWARWRHDPARTGP